MKTKTKGVSKPSTRRAAQKPKAAPAIRLVPTVEKTRFKWIVRSSTPVAEVVGDQLVTKYHVLLEATYEPLSILDGQATVQGNEDNRAFGVGLPEAAISLKLASQAIADTFVVGRAYHSDFSAVEPVVRALY